MLKDKKVGEIQNTVLDFITCKSDCVVYALFCPCMSFYIGKTIRPLFKCVREHMYSLRTGKGAPRLISHM